MKHYDLRCYGGILCLSKQHCANPSPSFAPIATAGVICVEPIMAWDRKLTFRLNHPRRNEVSNGIRDCIWRSGVDDSVRLDHRLLPAKCVVEHQPASVSYR